MKINTNSNLYTIIYASAVVVIVAFLLAFVSKILQPISDVNEQNDKKKQILAALNIRDLDKSSIESTYRDVVQQDMIIDTDGNILKEGKNKDQDGFLVASKNISEKNLPLYVCKSKDGLKYVIPLVGKGLWGSIWGYMAINEDGETIYGAYFAHESETAGLGARITEESFQKEFQNKRIFNQDNEIALNIVKKGQIKNPLSECDGISGATLTTNGVNQMLRDYLNMYKKFLKHE